MPVLVYQHSFDARRRLAELGVGVEAVMKAVKAGQVARWTCTENDPPFIPGTEAWRFVVRTLREELVPRGWRKADPGNYSLIINDDRKINIVVATGDQLTRVYPGSPRTKSLKGLYTEAAIIRNNLQDDFFPETVADELRQVVAILNYPVWILLIHIFEDVCRAELSLPSKIDGTVVEWAERIFIPDDDDLGGAGRMPEDEFGPDFDVPVKRRA